MHWYLLRCSHCIVKQSLCAVTVLEGPSAFGLSMTPLNSEADHSVLWQCWCRGVHLPLVSICFLYALVFPDIFSLSSEADHSVLWQCWWGGSICLWYLYVFSMHWYFLIFSHWTVKRSLCALTVLARGVHLPLVSICFLYALVFPDIFSLFDCFKWAIICNIEKHRVHSVLWQCWTGGGPSAFGIYMFPLCTGISLYTLISWPFRMGSHSCNIEKHRVHSVLWQFRMGCRTAWTLHLPNLSSWTFRCAHQ